jgi:phosphatidate phosphatase APP1
MDNVLHYFRRAANKVGEWLDKTTDIFDSQDPLLIMPYRGYANRNRLFLKGRVLENESIFEGKSESEIRTLINNFKRFESDELPDAMVRVKINGQTFETITDDEGYFTIDRPWESPLKGDENRWLKARCELTDLPEGNISPTFCEADIFLPSKDASFGVITDVDDTVLQTHVTSRFKLKMLYATFFQDAHQRLPMEGVVELFQALERGADGERENPIFYVSNSPWNIYDLLAEFMAVQKLPKGPILLRDYGIRPKGDFSGHKIESISHILNTYPELPFIMLGDTASKDADFYIELANKFPNRIPAIYIRQTRDNRNARRIAKLIEAQSEIDTVLVHTTKEIFEHARSKGFLR